MYIFEFELNIDLICRSRSVERRAPEYHKEDKTIIAQHVDHWQKIFQIRRR